MSDSTISVESAMVAKWLRSQPANIRERWVERAAWLEYVDGWDRKPAEYEAMKRITTE